MKLFIKNLLEKDAREISEWKYEGEYSIYNCLTWEEMVHQGWGLTDAKKRETEFHAVCDENNNLVGFFRLIKKKRWLFYAWCRFKTRTLRLWVW